MDFNQKIELESEKRIKVMIAEDHPIVRSAFINLFNLLGNIDMIGEAQNGAEMLELMKFNQPDILITDIEMPVMDGLMLISIVKEKYPNVGIIVVTQYFGNGFESGLISRGADVVLHKSCNPDKLMDAINLVYDKQFAHFKDDQTVEFSELNQAAKQSSLSPDPSLSHREAEILRLICDGLKNKEISTQLNISLATVETHRKNIYEKTGCTSIIQLTKFALRNGLTGFH